MYKMILTCLSVDNSGAENYQRNLTAGPSEAVRHGGGRRTKNLQGEKEKSKKRKERKKERREEKEKRGEKEGKMC